MCLKKMMLTFGTFFRMCFWCSFTVIKLEGFFFGMLFLRIGKLSPRIVKCLPRSGSLLVKCAYRSSGASFVSSEASFMALEMCLGLQLRLSEFHLWWRRGTVT